MLPISLVYFSFYVSSHLLMSLFSYSPSRTYHRVGSEISAVLLDARRSHYEAGSCAGKRCRWGCAWSGRVLAPAGESQIKFGQSQWAKVKAQKTRKEVNLGNQIIAEDQTKAPSGGRFELCLFYVFLIHSVSASKKWVKVTWQSTS